MTPFTKWLSVLLHERELDVQRLMSEPTALQFLIAWSLYESKCFKGFLQAKNLRTEVDAFTETGFPSDRIAAQLSHFHERYRGSKGAKALENLVHGKSTPEAVANDFKRCLSLPPAALSVNDQVFVVAFVVYRYRNNMFHGNKGVESWLRFKPQIELCITAMQSFITHSESVRPTLRVAEAA